MVCQLSRPGCFTDGYRIHTSDSSGCSAHARNRRRYQRAQLCAHKQAHGGRRGVAFKRENNAYRHRQEASRAFFLRAFRRISQVNITRDRFWFYLFHAVFLPGPGHPSERHCHRRDGRDHMDILHFHSDLQDLLFQHHLVDQTPPQRRGGLSSTVEGCRQGGLSYRRLIPSAPSRPAHFQSPRRRRP